MAKIGLDYGHGVDTFPPDKGVYHGGKGYPEHDFNTKLGLKVKKLLKEQGHTIIEGQKAQRNDVPLIQRTDLYNRENVDLVWSIHANAGGGNGRCAFYWHSANDSKKLAELYVDEVKKAGYSTHGNGLHAGKVGSWTNLHINRETNMTAVLTENGFMDTDADFELVFGSKQDEYTDDMAKVHVKAIQRYLNEDFENADTGKVHTPDHKEKSHTVEKDSKWTKVTGNWTGQTLGRGEYGKPVRQCQNKLASNNPPFYPNKGAKNNGVDSYYGANTKDAVTRYQSYYGLAVDGLAGKEVYKSLAGNKSSGGSSNSKSSGLPTGVLNVGDRGSDVRKVQKALASVYFYPNKSAKNHGIDGIYGANTKDAVRRFQSMHGLTQDGIYGPSTRKALLKAK
ncbi:hypothetical protein GCM10007063_05430 [Lentibacillus kapialis]|uniref:MurNAc-LAA domain-containing protein n=1 Tax=Lentibacillus kapialis TaxID=340214 RepID=A0A917PNL6_9BACI|nr:peptidoglycan-binding protein [Lentibacillus kapialis]GGJ85887.1 hypothetical protein GCM10007063_05430 [Lentibacillus kapialis]